MNQKNTNTVGQQAEDLALSFLKKQGLKLVERNYRNRFGEIDLIMKDKNHVAFVEVRFRSSNDFGGAISSVDNRKQAKLIKCALQYMTTAHTPLGFRFDVVAISPTTTQHEIQWITNAFDEF